MGADEVMLMAAVGADPEGDVDAFGAILTGEMRASGMRRDGLLFKQGSRTAVCSLVLGEQGGLIAGVADMDVAESITTDDVSATRLIASPPAFPDPVSIRSSTR